jgi:hypothetical protein
MKTTVTRKIMVVSAALFAATAPMAAFAAPPKSHAAKTHAAKTHKAKATTASAHEEYTSGTVESYASATRMLKLSTGNAFKLAPSITKSDFKNGDKVTVSWKMDNGVRLADKVETK